MIDRTTENIIKSKLFKKKAIIIFGARQVGKTTLLKSLFQDKKDTFWLNGDRIEDRTLLEKASATRLLSFLTNKKY